MLQCGVKGIGQQADQKKNQTKDNKICLVKTFSVGEYSYKTVLTEKDGHWSMAYEKKDPDSGVDRTTIIKKCWAELMNKV